MNKSIKLMLAGGLCLLLYGGMYLYAIHSDGFKFVAQTIKQSHNVEGQLGRVQKVTLSLFGAFKEKHFNSDQVVTMSVQAVGTQRTATINVRAEYRDGIWKVDDSSIDGIAIDLTK